MAKKMKTENSEFPPSFTDSAAGSSDSGQSNSNTSVTDQVSDMVDSAKQAGAQAYSQAKDQATTHVDQQRQTLASGVQAVAQAFQKMGEDLQTREEGPVAKYAAEMGQAIGGQVEQLATYLRERDVRTLVADTEDFARRSPTVFLASAFAIGVAASRFLKSSRPSSGSPATSNPRPNAAGPQLALPPASTPPAPVPVPSTDPDMPSGFPFDTPKPSSATSAASANPLRSAAGITDPVAQ